MDPGIYQRLVDCFKDKCVPDFFMDRYDESTFDELLRNFITCKDGLLWTKGGKRILNRTMDWSTMWGVILFCHLSPVTDMENAPIHLGYLETLFIIQQVLWWPGMDEDVYWLVETCPGCLSVASQENQKEVQQIQIMCKTAEAFRNSEHKVHPKDVRLWDMVSSKLTLLGVNEGGQMYLEGPDVLAEDGDPGIEVYTASFLDTSWKEAMKTLGYVHQFHPVKREGKSMFSVWKGFRGEPAIRSRVVRGTTDAGSSNAGAANLQKRNLKERVVPTTLPGVAMYEGARDCFLALYEAKKPQSLHRMQKHCSRIVGFLKNTEMSPNVSRTWMKLRTFALNAEVAKENIIKPEQQITVGNLEEPLDSAKQHLEGKLEELRPEEQNTQSGTRNIAAQNVAESTSAGHGSGGLDQVDVSPSKKRKSDHPEAFVQTIGDGSSDDDSVPPLLAIDENPPPLEGQIKSAHLSVAKRDPGLAEQDALNANYLLSMESNENKIDDTDMGRENKTANEVYEASKEEVSISLGPLLKYFEEKNFGVYNFMQAVEEVATCHKESECKCGYSDVLLRPSRILQGKQTCPYRQKLVITAKSLEPRSNTLGESDEPGSDSLSQNKALSDGSASSRETVAVASKTAAEIIPEKDEANVESASSMHDTAEDGEAGGQTSGGTSSEPAASPALDGNEITLFTRIRPHVFQDITLDIKLDEGRKIILLQAMIPKCTIDGEDDVGMHIIDTLNAVSSSMDHVNKPRQGIDEADAAVYEFQDLLHSFVQQPPGRTSKEKEAYKMAINQLNGPMVCANTDLSPDGSRPTDETSVLVSDTLIQLNHMRHRHAALMYVVLYQFKNEDFPFKEFAQDENSTRSACHLTSLSYKNTFRGTMQRVSILYDEVSSFILDHRVKDGHHSLISAAELMEVIDTFNTEGPASFWNTIEVDPICEQTGFIDELTAMCEDRHIQVVCDEDNVSPRIQDEFKYMTNFFEDYNRAGHDWADYLPELVHTYNETLRPHLTVKRVTSPGAVFDNMARRNEQH